MQEMDGETEPAHHARRPMNAFLIFCKRHRSVVRDKYPNLENRSITKILGEWWANLDKEEKACYTGLAKQYKDAFFSANPDFKWYKLPAPPLRTLSSRPRDCDKHEAVGVEYHDSEYERTNNNSTKIDFNKKTTQHEESQPKEVSIFTPGKLADEAQMGSLSSLLTAKTENITPNPYYSPFKFNSISTPTEYRSHNAIEQTEKEDNIRELQNALTETTKIFTEEFEEKSAGAPEDQYLIDQIVDKRYSKDEDGYIRNWSDDDKKSGRSCKGKRYQEFMAVGGLLVKRQRRDCDKMDEGYIATCSWDPGSYPDDLVNETTKSTSTIDTSTEGEKAEVETSESDNNINKTFKAADFDLDAKIKALPSLSLEKFQQKKRENKRKKKTINLKPKALESSQIINSVPRPLADERREMAEHWREQVIGSQKRKPRKISITRLEINSLVSGDRNGGHKISPEIKIATEAPSTVCGVPHGDVDLFALATLAEVAANTSKIESNGLAEVSEDPSEV
ncbi:unnamed protein product [Leptosia nina]|uniref:HMG box domain-containing protein n=1 Tax=Leptosia nina TaxID=320188 RepID=A0AAV1J3A4_9NEOP